MKYREPFAIIRLLSRLYYSPRFRFIRTKIYRKRFNILKECIKRKDKINVVFFTLNLSMWKYESLVKILLQDPHFNVRIIPFFYPHHTKEDQHRFENEIIGYCERMGFPYQKAYDIDTQEYISAKDLNADIITYTQHYNGGYDFWKLEKFWNHAIFFTTPYGIPIDEKKEFTNTLLQNIAWKNFFPSRLNRKAFEKNPLTHGDNFEYTGNPIYDRLYSHRPMGLDWKIKDEMLHKIIWAPHHSIGENDLLSFSTFMDICDDMIELAKEYRDRVQIAFKPHPYLKERLVEIWGKGKTESYYAIWDSMPNSTLVEGDYIDLFQTSNAMIHDCASFTAEYLFTLNPVMYLTKRNNSNLLTGFSKMCFNQHYQGTSIAEIRDFIDKVIINGEDKMKESRNKFYLEYLLPPNNKTVAENMYQNFVDLIEK